MAERPAFRNAEWIGSLAIVLALAFTADAVAKKGSQTDIDADSIAKDHRNAVGESEEAAFPERDQPGCDPASIDGQGPEKPPSPVTFRLRGSIGSESQFYPQAPMVAGQHGFQDCHFLEAQLDVGLPWDGEIRIHPRLRVNGRYPEENPFSFDDFYLGRHGDRIEWRAGYQIFSWKVVESYGQSDVLNQTDLRFDLLNAEKLGEPTGYLLLRLPERLGVSLEGYYLPHFTPAPLPRTRSRYNPAAGSPFRIEDREEAYIYDDRAKRWSLQGALRYNLRLGTFDISAYYFRGYAKFPALTASQTDPSVLVPAYRRYHQAGLNFQGSAGNWLWKGETAYHRSIGTIRNALGGKVVPYASATAGFEYAFYSAIRPDEDLTVVIEYLIDSDAGKAPEEIDGFRPFQDDLFTGLRYTWNGLSDASLTLGVFTDRRTRELFYRAVFQARVFTDFSVNAGLNGMRIDPGENPQMGFLEKSSNGFLGLKYYW